MANKAKFTGLKIKRGFLLRSAGLILLLAAQSKAFSQQTTTLALSVEGSDKIKIEEVIISVKYAGQPIKTTSEKSKASISIDTSGIDLISFYVLGYEPENISKKQLTSFLKQPGHGTYKVILKRKTTALNEIVINAKESSPFYQRQNILISDYDILANGNLIMITDKRIYLINKRDSIIDAAENKYDLDSIILDCSGKLYLKNSQHLYPVHIKGNTKIMIASEPLLKPDVIKTILEIKACNKDLRMREYVSNFNQQVAYVLQLVSKPHSFYNFYMAKDISQINLASAEKIEIDNGDVSQRMGEIDWKQNETIKKNMQKAWKFEFLTTKKIFAPIFILRDTIYIFDHTVKKINVYTYKLNDTLLEFSDVFNDSIAYHKKAGWQSYITQDRYTGKFYTLYLNNNAVLRSIKVNSAYTENEFILPKKHYFVDKVKIYNNCVYYLWRDKNDPLANKTLYKYEK